MNRFRYLMLIFGGLVLFSVRVVKNHDHAISFMVCLVAVISKGNRGSRYLEEQFFLGKLEIFALRCDLSKIDSFPLGLACNYPFSG